MTTLKKYLLLILTIILGFPTLYASHIVGGELFYDYLGGTNYKFTLKIYRNCNCAVGTNCSDYDEFTYIQLFDANGNYIDSLSIHIPPRDTIPPIVNNPCIVINNICVEEAFFTATVSLPPRKGGFTAVYQRCCRNINLQTIGGQYVGATYVAHVPTDSFSGNSSPRFKQRPPPFICANELFVFDHSATDPDGDSLSYELVSALDGGSFSCTNPSPLLLTKIPGCPISASPPPYASIPYVSPFSATNPTNNPSNANNLNIDPVSGIITGIPNAKGLFILAVAVHEWRNGVLVGTTIRDYQLNIVPCNSPSISVHFIPGTFDLAKKYGTYFINCKDYTVNFNQYDSTNPGVTPLSYHWDFGEAGFTNDTSNQRYPIYTYHDTGTYKVRVVVSTVIQTSSTQGPCYDTSYTQVKIYPIIVSNFTAQGGCQDSLATFTDLSFTTSSPLVGWSWSFGDGGTSTARNPTHQYNASGNFPVKLTITNQVGCTELKTDSVHIKEIPKPDFKALNACVFDSVHFTYTGTGQVALYNWDLTSGQTSILPSPSAVYNTVGVKNVKLSVVGIEGCPESVTKPVTINPLPTVTVSPDATICLFTTTQLSASGGTSYQWSPATTLRNANTATPTDSPIVSGVTTFTVTVTDANTCSATDSVHVTARTLPPVNAGVDTSVCLSPGSFRDSVRLQATGALSYVWSPINGLSNPNISNPLCRPDSNMYYVVTGMDGNGCKAFDTVYVYYLDPKLNLIVDTTKPICRNDTTTLNVLKQGLVTTYVWTPNLGISDPTINSPRFFPTVTTTYILNIKNYCYQKADTATILVHQLPNVQTEHIDSVCIGDSVQIHATGADTMRWRFALSLSDTTIPSPMAFPKVTTWYYVTGTDNFGCKNRDSVKVIVYLPPITFVKPDTSYICQGTTIPLRAFGGVRYQWRVDTTLSALNIYNPIATPRDSQWYYVRIYNIHNCHHDDSIHVNVQPPIVPHVDSAHYDICPGIIAHLSASGGLYYDWTPTRWLTNPHIAAPYSRPDSSIIYRVRVSNDCFFADAFDTIIVHQNPTVDAGTDTTIYRGTVAQLSGISNGISFYWYPGLHIDYPFSLSSPFSPIDTYNLLYLNAVSQFGCTATDSVVVRVVANTLLLIPTAFSPNGDGINDVFRIARHLNIDVLEEFTIYNRWGEKVFTTTDWDQGWDGTYNGQAQEISVFAWYVRAKTYDKQDVFQKGNVTLLR